MAFSETFGRVIHCFSQGDGIQNADVFSTANRRCLRVFDKAMLTKGNVHFSTSSKIPKLTQVEICFPIQTNKGQSNKDCSR